jgi:Ca2+-binding EF-hand superfamily protein
MDGNGNGVLEFEEFRKALHDFKIDMEEQDMRAVFLQFEENRDGTIQIEEFMNTILSSLTAQR